MKTRLLALPSLLAGSLFLAGCSHPHPVYYGPPPPPPQQQEAPSPVFQKGAHDGFEAARHDVSANQPPNFDRHPRFRNPPVPPPAADEYRAGFRQGYDQFLHQAPPPRSY